MRKALAVIAALFSCSISGLSADDDRESLRGLEGVSVLIDRLPEGVSRERIQTQVELKLRLAGIKVLTEQEWLAAPGKPFLHLQAQVITGSSEMKVYGCGISIGLNQIVVLSATKLEP